MTALTGQWQRRLLNRFENQIPNSADYLTIWVPMLFSGALSIMPVKETVWWNTPGGKVIEHRDQSGEGCSLTFYNDDGSIIVAWDRDRQSTVTVTRPNWKFSGRKYIPFAIQIGDVWLEDGHGSVVFNAHGAGTTVVSPLGRSADELLLSADHITVKVPNTEFSMKLNRTKVTTLVYRVRECRDALKIR